MLGGGGGCAKNEACGVGGGAPNEVEDARGCCQIDDRRCDTATEEGSSRCWVLDGLRDEVGGNSGVDVVICVCEERFTLELRSARFEPDDDR